ncbi:MAG: TRAP transporter small permease subunit [Thalassobaculaceae bacterium]|nr:TRAP transporter small permease subunit [Thalassobaculaceae bacterium]
MLSRLHARLDAGLCRIEVAALAIAGVAVVSAMLLVSADALMRYLIAAPLAFQLHVSEFYLLPASLMMALAWGYRTGGAIQISVLISVLPPKVVGPLTRALLAASAAYIAYLSWRSSLLFLRALERNEVVMGVVDWPVSLSWIWVTAGSALLAARLLLDTLAPTLRPIGFAHD